MNIETIRDWLINFAEDPEIQKQISKNVYDKIWARIQDIDHELEEEKKEKK